MGRGDTAACISGCTSSGNGFDVKFQISDFDANCPATPSDDGQTGCFVFFVLETSNVEPSVTLNATVPEPASAGVAILGLFGMILFSFMLSRRQRRS